MSDKDYEVGWGKPPKSGQFKPGKSGNPKGRPNGARGFKTDLEEALKASISVTKNGKSVKMTAQQAVIARLMEKALNGDIRALAEIISLTVKHFPDEPEENTQDAPLPKPDADILDRYVQEQMKSDGAQEAENEQDI